MRLFRNASVRQHIQTTRGLFPHKRVVRRSELTSKGLVVTEEEEISGLPTPGPTPSQLSSSSSSSSPPSAPSPGLGKRRSSQQSAAAPKDEPNAPRRSPIAELLYMRWLEGLKLKWPSLGGS
jgi:serine/threonine-protein kinase 24/25/MST4